MLRKEKRPGPGPAPVSVPISDDSPQEPRNGPEEVDSEDVDGLDSAPQAVDTSLAENRPGTWAHLRKIATRDGYYDEILHAVRALADGGMKPKEAKVKILLDRMTQEKRLGELSRKADKRKAKGSPAPLPKPDKVIWKGKKRISKDREVAWALDHMGVAAKPQDAPTAGAYAMWQVAEASPASMERFLKDHLPKVLKAERDADSRIHDDAAKLVEHIAQVEKIGSDAVNYEKELLRNA